MPTKVTLIPSLPAEGWLSMNRYWDALNRETVAYTENTFDFAWPLKPVGVLSNRSSKLNLAIQKKFTYPAKIRLTAKAGIAHILDHSYAFLLPSIPKGVKTIVTVHDLLPLHEPDGLNQSSLKRFRKRVEWIKHADLVISDSEATSRDLEELIGIDPAAIRVLPLGTDLPPEGIAAPRENLGRYLFSIGGYMKRKNLEILPEVLRIVRQTHPDIRLVRAGGRLPPALLAEFQRLCGKDSIIELGKVPEERLASLYSSALITVIPSKLEGFGLPLIEAMAHGCPIVAANATSLPEVGGDSASYFPADQPQQAAEKILAILALERVQLEELVTSARKRAGCFSWKRHFSSLLEIYEELACVDG